jgi:protein HIRA/HIR1
MSIDYYPNSNYIITSSFNTENDTGIRFWQLDGFVVNHVYDLQSGHSSTVNCVRFSPSGQYLASGGDDQLVIIWSLKMCPKKFGEREEAPQWAYPRQLRGHVGDVVDLAWSNNSLHLVSCSVDSTSILWAILPQSTS